MRGQGERGGPLEGRAVVVTRARAQAAEFVSWLKAEGAEPVEFPAIRIVAAPDGEPLRRAIGELGRYDWIVFTSVNGVEYFWRALTDAGLDKTALDAARIAAIGSATASALSGRGLRVDVVPERYVAEAVVEALEAAGSVPGASVLLPRAFGAREVLPRRLAELGAVVDEVEAYRAVPDQEGAQELRQRLAGGQIDAVTFTSSSTVRSFVDVVGVAVGSAIVACIGPITADTARELGLRVDVVATEHTIPGLERALVEYFESRSGETSAQEA